VLSDQMNPEAHASAGRDDLLEEQISYYRARAREYDRMLRRERRYDLDSLDPNSSDGDTRELAIVESKLFELAPFGDVLELACGPGWWTKRLSRRANSVTALDASPEMLELGRMRARSKRIRRIQTDIFAWRPDRTYDLVFFGFWLSHVPEDRFDSFWELVRRAVEPAGRVFFVDEMRWDGVEGYERALEEGRGAVARNLEDGRGFRLVKVYHQPRELSERLRSLGWDAEVVAAGDRIYWGTARRAPHALNPWPGEPGRTGSTTASTA
jgi:demethylmenaquinone methyltransferase/2-methoxy-6-polyprenyl-1,4-benzoquinol methylase